mmetsp:Transcript_13108/g.25728  ORF Transcript_13108/g.25728 Transcript_13108/m.25728 type:complete len:188 (+) Transcript_13108:71-634(+)
MTTIKVVRYAAMGALPRTAALIGLEMATGDSIEQLVHRRSVELDGDGAWDAGRSVRLGLTGLMVTGPFAHMLFRGLESIAPGTSTTAVVKKVCLNAAFMPCMIGATMSTAWLLEGRRPQEVAKLLRKELITVCYTGLAFWPAANIVVYKTVPVAFRPVVSSGFGGLWGVFMATKVARASANPSKARF